MRSRNSRTNRPTNAVRLARSVAWMTMRAAGKSAITASICMKRCGASGWSAGDVRRASSRAIAYGRSSSRAARDGSCAPAKRSRARVEKPRKTTMRMAAMITCTASGRASRAAYSRVLLLNARISSGTRGSSLRSSAAKPRCQSGARSRTKRLVPSATVAACSCSSAASTAVLRSTRRSLTASTRACQVRSRATASSRAWSELSTRRATTSPAAAVSGRPRVSDQTRRACASSSRICCYALRLGRELVLPAAERGRGALELVSHILDGRERGLLRNRGGRPLEQCVEIGRQRGDPCLDLLEGRLCRRVGPRRVQPGEQRVGPVGHFFGADPPDRRAVSGGWLRLGMTLPGATKQREKDRDEVDLTRPIHPTTVS